MTRILSVWCPDWPVTAWRRRNPSGAGPEGPFALLISERGTRRIHALDPAARALGLHVGQKAADAAALVPDLTTADADPEADAAALEALCDWCVRFSPAVAVDAPDGLLMDIGGVAHLWGGEAEMAADLVDRLAVAGIPARAAVADTAGAAWAFARAPEAPTVVPPGAQGPLLAALPVTALRLDAAAVAQLPRLGLTRIERLVGLPRAQLTRRFGPLTVLRLDQAFGRAPEALTFRRPPTPWFDRLAFAEPISAPEDLLRAAGDIVARLCGRLRTEGRGGRRFELAFHRVDGKALPVRVGLSRLGREPGMLVLLIAPRLETVDPGFGIEAVTLLAEEVERLDDAQGDLDAAAALKAEAALAALVDRLANRLGEAAVTRAEVFESHVPERAVRQVSPLAAGVGDGWPKDRPRPVRLLSRPEAIEVMAKLPDDPPLVFTWRGLRRRVRLAEGPERIAEEWWRKPVDDIHVGLVRDYYRVEDEDGGRFWIFRAGLYGEPGVTPRWWLHGVFA